MMYVANIDNIDQYSKKRYAGSTTLKPHFFMTPSIISGKYLVCNV